MMLRTRLLKQAGLDYFSAYVRLTQRLIMKTECKLFTLVTVARVATDKTTQTLTNRLPVAGIRNLFRFFISEPIRQTV